MLIKDVDFKLVIKFRETNDKVKELLNMSELVGKYIDEPETVLNSLLPSITDDEEKKRVNEILLGMRGEFTRSKSLELGKNKLVTLIKALKDEITIDYIELNNLFKEPLETIFDNYNVITNTSNNHGISLRKEQYMAKPLLIDYALRKLPSVVVPYINEAGSNKSVNEYLARLRDIIIIMDNFDVSDVKHMFEIYKNRKEYLEDLQKRYHKEFNNEFIKIELIEKQLNTADYIKFLVDGDTIVPEGKNGLDILNEIVDRLPKTIELLKADIDEITKYIKNNKTERSITNTVITDFINNGVIPYSDGEITKEVYIDQIAVTNNILKNSINIDLDVVNDVCDKLHELNILLNMYMVIHSIIDRITLYINIENSTMKVSGVSK